MSKYHAKKVTIDGIGFDSIKEAKRYKELKFLQRAGQIQNLELQKPYELIPAQRETDTVGKRGGIIKGKVIEKAVVYRADFVYTENGQTIVEDVKGVKTKDYIIKRKLMLFRFGIRIREI